MKQLALILVFVPVVAFCVAGYNELRSSRSAAEKLRNLIPITLGIAAFALSMNPQGLLHVTPNSSVTLSRVMTLFSAVVACSGVFITYSRRSSAVLVASGGLLLALFWMFNRIIV
jgi:hypothetical protein